MGRFATVLDPGACSSFITLDDLLHRLRDKIKPLGDDVTMLKASGKPFYLLESTVFAVQPGNSVEKVPFFVAH